MDWLLAFVIVVAGKPAVPQESVFDRMKVVYCYTRLSLSSQNLNLATARRERAKQSADVLFPRYQAAIEASKGRLTEEALKIEAARARDANQRLGVTESSMLSEACEALAHASARPEP